MVKRLTRNFLVISTVLGMAIAIAGCGSKDDAPTPGSGQDLPQGGTKSNPAKTGRADAPVKGGRASDVDN